MCWLCIHRVKYTMNIIYVIFSLSIPLLLTTWKTWFLLKMTKEIVSKLVSKMASLIEIKDMISVSFKTSLCVYTQNEYPDHSSSYNFWMWLTVDFCRHCLYVSLNPNRIIDWIGIVSMLALLCFPTPSNHFFHGCL